MNGVKSKKGLFTLKSGSNAGATAEAPRLFGIASEDIQCRCNYYEEIDDISDKLASKPSIGDEIVNMTYSEWKEWKKK